MNTQQKTDTYTANTYKHKNAVLTKGTNAVVTDENGKNYIDFTSGIGVNSFGFCDEKWIEAIEKQLHKIQHTSNIYYNEPSAVLAELICKKTKMKKVFFANSGAEANECAIKVARKYAKDKYTEQKNTIITLKNSFHGRTIATVSATGQNEFHKDFKPLLDGFKHTEANNIKTLKNIVTDDVCAIMFECVQGEGGVNTLDLDFVKTIEKICKEKDVLMIVDEVQTGNGRTGKLYAYEHFGIKPDIVTTAKGLGGGLPIGACILGEKVENTLTYGTHGSTFGSNPIVCAGAISVLERIDDEFLNNVEKKSKIIFNFLKEVKNVESVSGLGLMIGIKTNKNANEVAEKCLEKGLLVLTAKDKIRLLPPLTISESELSEGLKILKEVIEE